MGSLTLAEQLYFMMQSNQAALQPTDVAVGTVTRADPLEITINTAMAPLRREVLYLTQSVVEKKLPVLAHTHSTTGLEHIHTVGSSTTAGALNGTYQSSESLGDLAVLENGSPLPAKNGYIILNKGLAINDKVLLLRVESGQKYIVLSRIFD